MNNVIKIYCDGACLGNQKKNNIGGWGAILIFNDKIKKINGGEKNTTNQRMELTACIKALEAINQHNIQSKFTLIVHIYTIVCNKNGTKNGNKMVGKTQRKCQ